MAKKGLQQLWGSKGPCGRKEQRADTDAKKE
jgi:hypothetical protein